MLTHGARTINKTNKGERMKQIPVIIENEKFKLEIGSNACAKSLIVKSNGRECLQQGVKVPMFSITELRPYNNEIKLAYPNVRMEFLANGVKMDGDNLIISFDLLPFKAIVKVTVKPLYVEFKLVDFDLSEIENQELSMDYPPIEEFRLIQLPIKNLEKCGDWLNVMHDSEVAVNVLGNSPYPSIGNRKEDGYCVMQADARRGIKLKGCSAILIATETNDLLNAIDKVEDDYNLPRGVRSRQSKHINSSMIWGTRVNPQTVDEYITIAKKAGFNKMLMYYYSMFEGKDYTYNNSFVFNEFYPNGEEDVKYVLKKFNDAGIEVGIHFLHTHIGIKTKYMTPEVDHRINVKQRYTLSRPLGKEDDKVYVEESPEWAPMHEACRILTFNGELIKYEGYTTEYPYCFYGVQRGYNDTYVKESPVGLSGGVVDISEFSAISAYLNQNTDLQDEIAEKLANIYNLGFKFVYFDGSEGTNAPYDFHIANAQYRVYKRFNEPPYYCEGAAKTHFSWHMLSGGNAFDAFAMDIFKQNMKYPLEEIPRMRNDFTRINFGWWLYYEETQPDHFEYGASKAFSEDCPTTILIDETKEFPRRNDVFEVLRRWEDVKNYEIITQEQKDLIKNPDKEYTLLINEIGEYELCEYFEIKLKDDSPIKAFWFVRNGKSYVVYWHKTAECKISLPLDEKDVIVEQELGNAQESITVKDGKLIIPADNRKYLSSACSKEKLIEAFKNAQVCD